MTAAWMLYVLLVGSLLACAALAADVALRRTGIATRWAWALALAGSAVLAGVAPRVRSENGQLNFPLASDVRATPAAPSPAAPTITWLIASGRAMIERAISSGLADLDRRTSPRATIPIAIGWALLSAAILGLLVIVNRQVDRARRSWPVAQLHGSVVRIAPETGPAVVGLSHPEIVLPTWILERSAEEQRLVVMHEREHMAARDQLVLTGAWCVAALLPWHPAVWWMLARLRLAIELDCDARVLQRGVSPRPYGALLIDIAGRCAGLRVGALALADKTTHLERRLLAMKPTRSRFTFVRAAAFCSVAAVSILVACEARMPTASDVQSMDAAGAQRAAIAAKLLDEKRSTVFLVDGVVVPAEKAKAIPAERIASTQVFPSVNGEPAQISIVTLGAIEEDGKHLAEKTPEKLAVVVRDRTDVRDSVVTRRPRQKSAADTGSVGYALTKRAQAAGAPQPIVVIDGVLATKQQLNDLKRSDIASVDIIKGPLAALEWPDPAAVNGVIRITTKASNP